MLHLLFPLGSPCPPPPPAPFSLLCSLLPYPTFCDGHDALGLQVELDAMNGADELEALAKLEPEEEEGATMMGRKARELMLSGQGDAALQAFKVRSTRQAWHCSTAYSTNTHATVERPRSSLACLVQCPGLQL